MIQTFYSLSRNNLKTILWILYTKLSYLVGFSLSRHHRLISTFNKPLLYCYSKCKFRNVLYDIKYCNHLENFTAGTWKL